MTSSYRAGTTALGRSPGSNRAEDPGIIKDRVWRGDRAAAGAGESGAKQACRGGQSGTADT